MIYRPCKKYKKITGDGARSNRHQDTIIAAVRMGFFTSLLCHSPVVVFIPLPIM